MSLRSLLASDDPPRDGGYEDPKQRMGFFTDTSVCIGCKACEVACKEWNAVPDSGLDWTGMSYDNTGKLDANTWRPVALLEQRKGVGSQTSTAAAAQTVDLGMPSFTRPGDAAEAEDRSE